MRNAMPLLILLLAAVAGYWLLVGGDADPGRGAFDGAPEGDAGTPARPEGPATLHAEGSTPAPAPTTPAPAVRPLPDPRTLPTGGLVVRVLGPDGQLLPARDLQVVIEPRTRGAWRARLPLYDEARNSWILEKVAAGPVSVRVRGDHVVERTMQGDVARDQETVLDVEVQPAGAIRYDVIAYDQTRPDPVKLVLHDWQDKPVKAWYQERTSRRLTTPKQVEMAEIGPEGVILGILPGRYTLRVLSPNDEGDEAKVEVEAGKTAVVSLEVRR